MSKKKLEVELYILQLQKALKAGGKNVDYKELNRLIRDLFKNTEKKKASKR